MSDRVPSPESRFPALARLESLSIRGSKLGLEAIDALCERLGRPEKRVPSVLIAGTNGKGSTAATLSAIATAGGLRAGLYTSPHLICVTERVRVQERDVSETGLDEALLRVFRAADARPEIPATYFEALTASAFLLFADLRLDLAILEVGLGGRLDATNVASPELSIVTSISLDHTQELGSTIGAIAAEKAGVFRRGKPALVDAALEEAMGALRAAAAETGAVLHELEREVSIDSDPPTLEGTRLRLRTPQRAYELESPLPGEHQARNTALAVRAAELLSPLAAIGADAVAQGVGCVRWPGRLERFRFGARPVLLDGCHNPDGARRLAAFLAGAGLRPDLIFGAMADKDIEAMMEVLTAQVGEVRIVPVDSARAATPEELLRRISKFCPRAAAAPALDQALQELLSRSGEKPIIVAGSLYLVGQARALLLDGRIGEKRV